MLGGKPSPTFARQMRWTSGGPSGQGHHFCCQMSLINSGVWSLYLMYLPVTGGSHSMYCRWLHTGMSWLNADTSLSGMRMVRELDQISARRANPKTIVSDNGTEMTSRPFSNDIRVQSSNGIRSRLVSRCKMVLSKALTADFVTSCWTRPYSTAYIKPE